jgi:hypothetical protein
VSLAEKFPPRRDPVGRPLSMPAVERKKPKPIKKVNRERKAARLERDFGDPQPRACRRMPCCVCSRRPADPAHIVSRGAGGRPDQCVPLCRRCHSAQHSEGIKTFQERRGINLELVAAEIASAIKQHDCANWTRLEDGGLRAVCSICEAETEEPKAP